MVLIQCIQHCNPGLIATKMNKVFCDMVSLYQKKKKKDFYISTKLRLMMLITQQTGLLVQFFWKHILYEGDSRFIY